MLLTLDIGNTNIKIGLFKGDELIQHWRIATAPLKMCDDYAVTLLNLFAAAGIEPSDPKACAIASVVPPLTEQFIALSTKYLKCEPVVLGRNLHSGITLNGTPLLALGADRAANCVAALAASNKSNDGVIVVSLGTATTIDAISSKREYLGGAIAPGLTTSAKALSSSTALLPQVDLAAPSRMLGTNTAEQLRIGIVVGFTSLVEGLVHRSWRELGKELPVYATGGHAALIATQTKVISHVEPNLTLLGLRLLSVYK